MVYPPVDINFYYPDTSQPERRALVVSALVPYKRIDIAIDACRRAAVPLTIVGGGPERGRLERAATAAGADVRFTGRISDEEVRNAYRRAAVVLLPGEEDFGIVPVEAQACGRPVVAINRGGAAETVVAGETGILVDESSPAAFADGIGRALSHRFDTAAIRRHAEQFSRARFAEQIGSLVTGTTAAPDQC